MAAEQVVTIRGPWIRSPGFDSTLVFGGALLALAISALALLRRDLMPLLFWGWILLADAPHMFATYVRTVLNPSARATMRPLLLRSLWTLALGPACLALDAGLGGTPRAFLAFNALASTYGFYHVVRQHYGYLALYRARAPGGEPSTREYWSDKVTLYAGALIPYLYFVVSHPRSRAMLGLPNAARSINLALAFGVPWLLSLLVFCIETLRAKRNIGPKLWYGVTVILFHGLVYGIIGCAEPVYASSNGPNQDFLLLVILTSVFHNLQYVAMVHAMEQRAPNKHKGALAWIFPLFLLGYVTLAIATGVFPLTAGFSTSLGPFRVNDLLVSLWWGVSIHHYYLDQHIWRFKRNTALRSQLLPAA
jgi:hypothetical protein